MIETEEQEYIKETLIPSIVEEFFEKELLEEFHIQPLLIGNFMDRQPLDPEQEDPRLYQPI